MANLHRLLGLSSPASPVVVVIDGLDRLMEAEGAEPDGLGGAGVLDWAFPAGGMPACAKLLVLSRPCKLASLLQEELDKDGSIVSERGERTSHAVTAGEWKLEEARECLAQWHRVQRLVRDRIVDCFSSSSLPCHLQLAYDLAVRRRRGDFLTGDYAKQVRDVLDQAGPVALQLVTYVHCARRGLTFFELASLLDVRVGIVVDTYETLRPYLALVNDGSGAAPLVTALDRVWLDAAFKAAGGDMAVEQVRSKLAQYAEREDVEDEERWMAEIGFQHRRLELTIEDGSVLFNLGYIERMAAAGLLSFVLSELRALASPMAKQWFAFCARWRTVLISNPTAIHQQALLEPVGSSVRDAIQTSDRHACFRVLDEHKIDADVALLCMAVKSNARHVAFGQSCSGGTSGAAVVWSPETDQRGMLSDKSDAVGGGAVVRLPHDAPVTALCLARVDGMLATAAGGKVTVWDWPKASVRFIIGDHLCQHPARSLAVSSGGHFLAVCGADSTVSVWDGSASIGTTTLDGMSVDVVEMRTEESRVAMIDTAADRVAHWDVALGPEIGPRRRRKLAAGTRALLVNGTRVRVGETHTVHFADAVDHAWTGSTHEGTFLLVALASGTVKRLFCMET